MPNNQVAAFINTIKNGEAVDLTLYKDPRFCKDLRIDASKKIQALLAELLEIHLHFETRKDHFYLSSFINKTDANGFNMLDYCVIAGLDQFSRLFSVLGCEPHKNVVNLHSSLREYYNVENAPSIIYKIRAAYFDIERGKLQNIQTPLNQNKKTKSGRWHFSKLKLFCKNHKIPLIFICIGVTCLVLTPVTFGASSTIGTVLLFSVGIPAIYAGLSNLQSSKASKKSYDQANDSGRTNEEAKIIRVALELITEYIFDLEKDHCSDHNIISINKVIQATNKPAMIRFRSRSDATEIQPKVKLKALVRSNSW